MHSWQKLFNRATAYHQTGKLNEALVGYRKVLIKYPRHADALHLMGIILADQGKVQEGLEYINKAIAIRAGFVPYYLNRGLVFSRLQQFTAAIKDFNHALSLGYRNAQSYGYLGDALLANQSIQLAIEAYQHTLKFEPNNINVCHNLGNAYLAQKDYVNAASCYKTVLELKPDSAETLTNLGIVLVAQNKINEAINYHQKALAIKPNFIQAYNNLGLAYNQLRNFSAAETTYRTALTFDQNNPEVYLNLGTNHRDQNQIEQALECFQKAAALKPSAEAEFNQAISFLLLGDFINGWPKYEARLKIKSRALDINYPQPLWQGEDLTGKSLLVHVEQGLGDTLQFFRYLKLFTNPTNIALACQNELADLLKPYFPNILPRRIPEQHFDYQIPIMSLPLRFGTNSLNDIPFSEGYLTAPNHLTDLIDSKQFKIGIAWSGNKQNPNDRNRSIPLKMFESLLNLNNVKFYSLQWGESAQDIELLNFQDKLFNAAKYVKNLQDTASIVTQLDLLITVDTAIAHLSGALNKPTWILIPFAPDFRWLLNRNDSPWYQSVRLFRQAQSGDWNRVMQDVKMALLKRVALAPV